MAIWRRVWGEVGDGERRAWGRGGAEGRVGV
jgi:hypothetical protein